MIRALREPLEPFAKLSQGSKNTAETSRDAARTKLFDFSFDLHSTITDGVGEVIMGSISATILCGPHV